MIFFQKLAQIILQSLFLTAMLRDVLVYGQWKFVDYILSRIT